MSRMLLALVLAAGWAPTAAAGEWRSMEQLHDCAAGGCWQTRDADGRVVVAANTAGSKEGALTPSKGALSTRQGLAGSVPPLGQDAVKKDEGGSAFKRGADKAWGFVKDNWPGIAGGVAGGIIGSVFFGPLGGIIGGLIGSLLGHFAAGFFGKKS
ncbi:MAG: hypothetical protein HY748_05125 [Elusimicrobia bacterium]|nr:hypothetical protein [Elusimicrobiota bacterium]